MKKFAFWKASPTVRQKLVVAFLVVALVPLGGLIWFNNQATQVALTDAANLTLLAAASESETALNTFFNNNLNTLNTLAQWPVIVEFLQEALANRPSSRDIYRMFLALNNNDTGIITHILLDNQGEILAFEYGTSYLGIDVGYSKATADYFQIPLNTREVYISNVEFAKNGQPVLYFSVPIRDIVGNVIGILVRVVDANVLQTLLASKGNLAGEQSFVVLLNENSMILAHSSQPDLIFKLTQPVAETELHTLQVNHLLPDLPAPQLLTPIPGLAQELTTTTEVFFFSIKNVTSTGEIHQAVAKRLQSQDWVVIFFQPQAVFLTPVKNQTQTSLALAAIITLGVFILALGVTQLLTRPVIHLTEIAQQVAHGNFNVQAKVTSYDEIGDLAQTFNDMTTHLRQLIADLKQQSTELKTYSTELEQKNQQLQEMGKLKDAFLANTSHELKTPLNGIIGIAESMIEGATGPISQTQSKNLALVVASGNRLSNLVNDILDFSKLRHKDLTLQYKPTFLQPLVEMILVLTTPLVAGKSVALINNISSDLPPVFGDDNRIQQILLNLIGNAIKFTSQGQIEVTARVVAAEVFVSITDTGIGIAPDKLTQIFEPFEQADGSIARQFGGTGIGLALTKQLVLLHGGNINVTSTPNQGSTFEFTLPVATEEYQAENIPPEKTLPVQRLIIDDYGMVNDEELISTTIADKHVINKLEALFPNQEQLNILIVDDEPINRQVLVNQLSLYNYQITTASDGLNALDLLEKKEFMPDLIVLDVMMPQLSGYDVSRKIRQTYSPTELPIIMLTAKNRELDLIAGFEAGANDYLAKPFSKVELLARIKTHLQLTNLYNLNVSKDKIFSIVAHDLRSPFHPVLNYTQLLMDETFQQDAAKVARIAKTIHHSAQNVYNLLENLLEWSQLQRGRIAYNPDFVNLHHTAQQVVQLLQENAQAKNIDLKNETTLKQFVLADIAMLNAILRNLTANAIKFTPADGQITISNKVSPQSADLMEISVTDTGVGMSLADQQKLFKFNAHHSTRGTAQEKGAGLGLIICQEMVEKHGGTIWVESELGLGTSVKFTLPSPKNG